MKQYFDNYISIGYNCQVAYSIEALYNTTISNMFNWTFVINNKKLLDFLKKPDLLFSKGIKKTAKMYRDIALDFSFHSKVPRMSTLVGEALEKDKKEVISRMNHLKDKFFNMVKSNERNLFIMCFRSSGLPEGFSPENILDEIYSAIEELSGNKDFRILVVFEKNYLKKLKIKKRKKLIIKTINWFSYDRFAYDIDWWQWYRIYRPYTFEFERKNNDKFANIKNFVEKYKLHPIPIPWDLKLEEIFLKIKRYFIKK